MQGKSLAADAGSERLHLSRCDGFILHDRKVIQIPADALVRVGIVAKEVHTDLDGSLRACVLFQREGAVRPFPLGNIRAENHIVKILPAILTSAGGGYLNFRQTQAGKAGVHIHAQRRMLVCLYRTEVDRRQIQIAVHPALKPGLTGVDADIGRVAVAGQLGLALVRALGDAPATVHEEAGQTVIRIFKILRPRQGHTRQHADRFINGRFVHAVVHRLDRKRKFALCQLLARDGVGVYAVVLLAGGEAHFHRLGLGARHGIGQLCAADGYRIGKTCRHLNIAPQIVFILHIKCGGRRVGVLTILQYFAFQRNSIAAC